MNLPMVATICDMTNFSWIILRQIMLNLQHKKDFINLLCTNSVWKKSLLKSDGETVFKKFHVEDLAEEINWNGFSIKLNLQVFSR